MEHKLIAYFEGTLDASERREVEAWLQNDAGHQQVYDNTIRIWQDAAMQPTFQLYDKEKAWKKISGEIERRPAPVKAKIFRLKNWSIAVAAAAAIIAFIIICPFILSSEQLFKAATTATNIQLKDNSKVLLFPGGSLAVDKDFNKKERKVRLHGDARFDIAKNADKLFTVDAGGVAVQVLGTAFTIQQRGDFNTIFVHSGKVKAVFGNQSVVATANQKIVKNNKTQSLEVNDMKVALDDVLKTQLIRCNNMRIDSLAKILQELYNVHVEVDGSVASKRITSTFFSYESAAQAIEDIALTMNVSWSKKNDIYIITK